MTGDLDWLATAPRFDADALCAEVDPELMFPEVGGSTREAKKLCNRCEIRDACLLFALDHDERWGVWGGKSETQRRAMRRQRKAVA